MAEDTNRLHGFSDAVLFELRFSDGSVCALKLSGEVTGLPAGAVVVNYALPLATRLIGEMKLELAAGPAA